jgi:hypothetical protein
MPARGREGSGWQVVSVEAGGSPALVNGFAPHRIGQCRGACAHE